MSGRAGLWTPDRRAIDDKPRRATRHVGSCPECASAFVSCRSPGKTLLGFGECEHGGPPHDTNAMTRAYKCGNGHETFVTCQRVCPACGWLGSADERTVARWPLLWGET